MRPWAATGLLGAVLAACGLLFALPSLLVPGLTLVTLAFATATWVHLAARRAALEGSARPARVQEGDPLVLEARARLPRSSPPGELNVRSLGTHHVAGRRMLELRAEVRAGRRGSQTVGPVSLYLRDPLGLAPRVAAEESVEILVLPRIEPVRPVRGVALGGFDAIAGRVAGPELEFDSLRPHRAGSPASRLHWPTVARTDELVERRLRPESDRRPLVVLDSAYPASEEGLDRAVRAAASLCRALAARGGCRLLLPGDRRVTSVEPDMRAWPAAHVRLAMVEPAEAAARLPASLTASSLFWVLAATHSVPRALTRAAAVDRYLVTPGHTHPLAAFTVAGCTGTRVERVPARAA